MKKTPILADNGYYTEDNLKYADKNNLNLFIPNKSLPSFFKKSPEEL